MSTSKSAAPSITGNPSAVSKSKPARQTYQDRHQQSTQKGKKSHLGNGKARYGPRDIKVQIFDDCWMFTLTYTFGGGYEMAAGGTLADPMVNYATFGLKYLDFLLNCETLDEGESDSSMVIGTLSVPKSSFQEIAFKNRRRRRRSEDSSNDASSLGEVSDVKIWSKKPPIMTHACLLNSSGGANNHTTNDPEGGGCEGSKSSKDVRAYGNVEYFDGNVLVLSDVLSESMDTGFDVEGEGTSADRSSGNGERHIFIKTKKMELLGIPNKTRELYFDLEQSDFVSVPPMGPTEFVVNFTLVYVNGNGVNMGYSLGIPDSRIFVDPTRYFGSGLGYVSNSTLNNFNRATDSNGRRMAWTIEHKLMLLEDSGTPTLSPNEEEQSGDDGTEEEEEEEPHMVTPPPRKTYTPARHPAEARTAVAKPPLSSKATAKKGRSNIPDEDQDRDTTGDSDCLLITSLQIQPNGNLPWNCVHLPTDISSIYWTSGCAISNAVKMALPEVFGTFFESDLQSRLKQTSESAMYERSSSSASFAATVTLSSPTEAESSVPPSSSDNRAVEDTVRGDFQGIKLECNNVKLSSLDCIPYTRRKSELEAKRFVFFKVTPDFIGPVDSESYSVGLHETLLFRRPETASLALEKGKIVVYDVSKTPIPASAEFESMYGGGGYSKGQYYQQQQQQRTYGEGFQIQDKLDQIFMEAPKYMFVRLRAVDKASKTLSEGNQREDTVTYQVSIINKAATKVRKESQSGDKVSRQDKMLVMAYLNGCDEVKVTPSVNSSMTNTYFPLDSYFSEESRGGSSSSSGRSFEDTYPQLRRYKREFRDFSMSYGGDNTYYSIRDMSGSVLCIFEIDLSRDTTTFSLAVKKIVYGRA